MVLEKEVPFKHSKLTGDRASRYSAHLPSPLDNGSVSPGVSRSSLHLQICLSNSPVKTRKNPRRRTCNAIPPQAHKTVGEFPLRWKSSCGANHTYTHTPYAVHRSQGEFSVATHTLLITTRPAAPPSEATRKRRRSRKTTGDANMRSVFETVRRPIDELTPNSFGSFPGLSCFCGRQTLLG